MGMGRDGVVISSASRTPMGGFGGDFSEVSAPKLGGAAISAALKHPGPALVEILTDAELV